MPGIMSVITHYCSGNNSYIVAAPKKLLITFKVDAIGGLTRIAGDIDKENLIPHKSYSVTDLTSEIEIDPLVKKLRLVLTNFNDAIKKIGTRLNWQTDKDGLALFDEFTLHLTTIGAEHWESLDLSNLDLKTLPPQIGLMQNLEKLNLKDNDLHLLPPELQRLPLKELNISGNKRLQSRIPAWIGSKEIKLIAYRIGLCYLPDGLEPDHIECETDFSLLNFAQDTAKD